MNPNPDILVYASSDHPTRTITTPTMNLRASFGNAKILRTNVANVARARFIETLVSSQFLSLFVILFLFLLLLWREKNDERGEGSISKDTNGAGTK